MKYLFVLIIALVSCFGCSETEQPLEADEKIAETLEEAVTLGPAMTTVRLKIFGGKRDFYEWIADPGKMVLPDGEEFISAGRLQYAMVTNVGTPMLVYRLVDGVLLRQEVIFKQEFFCLAWFHMGDERVLVNLLSEQIPFMTYVGAIDIPTIDPETGKLKEHAKQRLQELEAEERKIFMDEVEARGGEFLGPAFGWVDAEGVAIDLPDPEHLAYVRWEQEFSIHPFGTGAYEARPDEIEVSIMYTHIYEYWDSKDKEFKERKMLFVRILRNLTRPHITFPRPLGLLN